MRSSAFSVLPVVDDSEKDVVDVAGRCADFCAAPGPINGAPLDRHGPWCRSAPCGREVSANGEDGPLELTVDLARRYLHGRYRRADRHADDAVYLGMRIDAVPPEAGRLPQLIYLSSAAARQLAATLVRAADQADRLDVQLNDAWKDRERQRHTAT